MEKEEKVTEEPKKVEKKKKSFLKGLIIFIVTVGVIVAILGFILPGLLWPKNLGVKYTDADYESVMEKLSYTKDEAPSNGEAEDYTYTYGENNDVEVEFTSEEISAFFNENRPGYYAVKNVQVKVNEDGTIEASGSINVDYVLNEFLSDEFSKEEIKDEIPALGLLPNNVNIYFKVGGSITDSKVSPSVESVSVQGIPIPAKYSSSKEALNRIVDGINNLMATHTKKTNTDFKSIKVEDSKIIFNGSVPSSLERTKN